jgi:hypothetical protein
MIKLSALVLLSCIKMLFLPPADVGTNQQALSRAKKLTASLGTRGPDHTCVQVSVPEVL